MGKFKQLDQERQESAISDLENWKKTDKFEVGLLNPEKTKEFVKWLEKNGHTVIKANRWISVNGITLEKDVNVSLIFIFLTKKWWRAFF